MDIAQAIPFISDSASFTADSLLPELPPAFLPLQSQDPYVTAFDAVLQNRLDSNMHLVSVSSSRPEVEHAILLKGHPASMPVRRDTSDTSVLFFTFLLYMLWIAFNRIRTMYSAEGVSHGRSEHLLPHLFHVDDPAYKKPFFLRSSMAVWIGFSFCLFVLSPRASVICSDWQWWWRMLLFSGAFFAFKLLLYASSSFLLDLEPQTIRYLRKKVLAYYDLLLVTAPLAMFRYFYSMIPVWIFPILLAIVSIYLIINGFFIFSKTLKSYGNFLYFCTLEILPLVILVKLLVSY